MFQLAGIIMIVLGMFGKIGALFSTIPDPVIGGMLHISLALLTAVGLAPLQFCDMRSTRNLIILGLSLFTAVMMPQWLAKHPDAIDTGTN